MYELLLFSAATYGCLHVERNYSLSLPSHLHLTLTLVRAKQAQLGPLDGRGFETQRVQNTLLPNPPEGSAPSLRAAALESASCRRLGVTQAVASVPRAARPWPCATPYLTLTLTVNGFMSVTIG